MKMKDIFQYVLGILIVTGFFVLLYLLISKSIPTENKDLLNLVVGALIGNFGLVVGYFYGSSSSSAKKDETIDSMLKK